MSNWIVTLNRGPGRDPNIAPDAHAALIVPDQVDRYPMVTLKYNPDYTVTTTVLIENCTKAEALASAADKTRFMLDETRYIG